MMPAFQSDLPQTDPKLIITRMEPRHIDQVLTIERLSYSIPWSRQLFRAVIGHPQALALVALTLPSGEVAGFLCLWLEGGKVHVQNLTVHPDRRRQGVGSLLIEAGLGEAAERGAKLATLEVRPSNQAALALYRSSGFREVGRKPFYYQAEGEDAILMNCDMNPDAS